MSDLNKPCGRKLKENGLFCGEYLAEPDPYLCTECGGDFERIEKTIKDKKTEGDR